MMSVLSLALISMSTACSSDEPDASEKFKDTEVTAAITSWITITPTKCKRSGNKVTFCFNVKNNYSDCYLTITALRESYPTITYAEDNEGNRYWPYSGDMNGVHEYFNYGDDKGFSMSKKAKDGSTTKCTFKYSGVSKTATYFKTINYRIYIDSEWTQLTFKNVPIY